MAVFACAMRLLEFTHLQAFHHISSTFSGLQQITEPKVLCPNGGSNRKERKREKLKSGEWAYDSDVRQKSRFQSPVFRALFHYPPGLALAKRSPMDGGRWARGAGHFQLTAVVRPRCLLGGVLPWGGAYGTKGDGVGAGAGEKTGANQAQPHGRGQGFPADWCRSSRVLARRGSSVFFSSPIPIPLRSVAGCLRNEGGWGWGWGWRERGLGYRGDRA
ncbi:hypothetical protein AXG93_107s1170 [Marchantia polymorpha subsp. ruderalis]|uniref:Uncharacterized protein n=1 Tax=Marchantia polymorpha subsp. ruderalis TaxID=1480154 RepID=A0A176WIN8_MARPO|nr:hypothetical protein AXG93_107s1170 [Marchantia polymorpha subsp. ruderalis]